MSWSDFKHRAHLPEAQPSLEGSEALPVHPAVVLVELCELLEDYGPLWYSEELRGRVFAALGILLESMQHEGPGVAGVSSSVVSPRLKKSIYKAFWLR
jgi:hypothetical protein